MTTTTSYAGPDAVAAKVMALLRDRSIAPTPANYTVWYEYVLGANAELKALGDRLLTQTTPITTEISDWMYANFAPEQVERRSLMSATDTVTTLVAEVVAQLTQAGSSAETYGEALGAYAAMLDGPGAKPGTAQALKTLLTATRKMHADNAKLEQELAQSTQQITVLQGTLEDARRDATTDKLTGLPNRRAFDQVFDEAVSQATLRRAPLSLLMIDVDHFKKFNDTYGHQTGDAVLKLVARTLTDTVKGRDHPARYGGEEFAIVLPDTTAVQARTVAEQVRQAMASRRIVRRNSGVDYGQVTVSVGVASLHPGDDCAALVARADAALYAAKRAGRNRVVVEGQEPGAVPDIASRLAAAGAVV